MSATGEKQKKDLTNVHQGRNLARFRKLKDITQATMAEALDIDKRTLANWEAGKTIPGDKINLCAEFLKIDPYYIEFATEEDLFSKFSNNEIGVVAESEVGVIAEEGATVEYNENPLKALVESHEKEVNRLFETIKAQQKRIEELQEAQKQELLKQIQELKERNK